MRCKFSKLNICRLVAAVIAVMLTAALYVPCVSAVKSGSCGSGVNWQYADGTLIISGKGAMNDYSQTQPAPWYSFKQDIRLVIINDGVTSVGNLAFYEHDNLTSATLADSITSIGKFAFANCVKLSLLKLSSGLQTIGTSAFECCESLSSVRLPDGLMSIAQSAFYRCYSLRNITIPTTVTDMGIMCFTYCDGLVSATVNAIISKLPEWTFYGCDALSDVTLSATITSIGRKAFYRCDNLSTVYYLGLPQIGVSIVSSIRESLPDADITLKCTSNTSGQSQSTVIYLHYSHPRDGHLSAERDRQRHHR